MDTYGDCQIPCPFNSPGQRVYVRIGKTMQNQDNTVDHLPEITWMITPQFEFCLLTRPSTGDLAVATRCLGDFRKGVDPRYFMILSDDD